MAIKCRVPFINLRTSMQRRDTIRQRNGTTRFRLTKCANKAVVKEWKRTPNSICKAISVRIFVPKDNSFTFSHSSLRWSDIKSICLLRHRIFSQSQQNKKRICSRSPCALSNREIRSSTRKTSYDFFSRFFFIVHQKWSEGKTNEIKLLASQYFLYKSIVVPHYLRTHSHKAHTSASC